VREVAPDPTGGPATTVRRLDRDRLVLVQTPQGFRVGLFRKALERAAMVPLPPDATDDAALIEMLGHPVAIVEGSHTNFKITRPEDLKLAESFLRGLS
jgi:2-C-methyl-D-erythritol 4-phosphate cytidylyltransferase